MAGVSAYASQLPDQARQRYNQKLNLIGSLDPFLLPSIPGLAPSVDLPLVEASDIVAYLVLQTSFLTTKQFKAHKSLEAYNQLVNGWVKDVQAWGSINGKVIVCGRVKHSQRCNDTPLSCWLICEEEGEICCGHCTCMAGLGEACTHIGAVLFYLETATKLRQEKTCTQQKCQWVIPQFQRDIPYLPVKDLDFSSAETKKKKIECAINNPLSPMVSGSVDSSSTPPSTSQAEIDDFFQKLSQCCTKPAILSIVDPYSIEYVPKVEQPCFPTPLSKLFDEKCLTYSYLDLLAVCEQIEITLTEEMATLVESETRAQSNSNLWFTYRAGRITASKMKSACHTDSSNPSQSLVKAIFYPEAYKFSSKATSWGCKHEKQARDHYKKLMSRTHPDISVSDCGLCLNCKWPHLGASPDGVVICSCCGKGVVEIKCPYCHRNDDISESVKDNHSCLKRDCKGCLRLDHTHAYYYQVQTQLFVCGVDYCDFVVCTFPGDSNDVSIHVERISADSEFWAKCVEQSQLFFNTCILPEIVGRWYTRPSNHNLQDSTSEDIAETVYCYCKQPEDERQMIACDNPSCSIEWFHTDCLKIKCIPKGKWYCPTCRTLPEFRVKRQKHQNHQS